MFNAIKTLARKVARWLWRDAVTGRFVSKNHAERNPRTTTKERVK